MFILNYNFPFMAILAIALNSRSEIEIIVPTPRGSKESINIDKAKV